MQMLGAVGLLQSLSSIPLLPMTDKKEKMPIWIFWNPSSSGKGTSESLGLLPLSFIIMLFFPIQYIASPCVPSLFFLLSFSTVSLFLPSSSTLLTSTLLHSFFCCFFFLLPPHSPSSVLHPSFPLSRGVLDQRGVLVPGSDNTSR